MADFLFLVLKLFLLFSISKIMINHLGQFILSVTRNESIAINIIAILFLPGVLIHELAHAIFAGILQVRVGEIKLFPEQTENGIILGKAMIGKTDPLRRTIIGLAPILLGSIVILAIFQFLSTFETKTLTINLIFYLTLFEIGNTMFSSRKDLEGTIVFFIILILLLITLIFIGANPEIFIERFLNSNSENFLLFSSYLTPIIIIDIGVILLTQFLRGLIRR